MGKSQRHELLQHAPYLVYADAISPWVLKGTVFVPLQLMSTRQMRGDIDRMASLDVSLASSFGTKSGTMSNSSVPSYSTERWVPRCEGEGHMYLYAGCLGAGLIDYL